EADQKERTRQHAEHARQQRRLGRRRPGDRYRGRRSGRGRRRRGRGGCLVGLADRRLRAVLVRARLVGEEPLAVERRLVDRRLEVDARRGRGAGDRPGRRRQRVGGGKPRLQRFERLIANLQEAAALLELGAKRGDLAFEPRHLGRRGRAVTAARRVGGRTRG